MSPAVKLNDARQRRAPYTGRKEGQGEFRPVPSSGEGYRARLLQARRSDRRERSPKGSRDKEDASPPMLRNNCEQWEGANATNEREARAWRSRARKDGK